MLLEQNNPPTDSPTETGLNPGRLSTSGAQPQGQLTPRWPPGAPRPHPLCWRHPGSRRPLRPVAEARG